MFKKLKLNSNNTVSSILLTVIYTFGHIIIAMSCNYFITGAKIELAAIDALIEPSINAVWLYGLHRLYIYYFSR